ncbi:MAG: PKD domain-containing protein, partial [Saprospiraceae bacterium]|nr:PKD domain-containing protein [Saprospiraceae bacterium]
MRIKTVALCLLSLLILIACGGDDNLTMNDQGTNSAPVANAGIDQNVITGLEVRLDGSGCGDANADMLTYAWTIQSAPVGSSTILRDATGVNPTFTADLAGTYVFKLVVNDGK